MHLTPAFIIQKTTRIFPTALALVVASTLSLSASCSKQQPAQRYSKAKLTESLASGSSGSGTNAGLIIGEYDLPPKAVVDGDTIKVIGLDASVRLLAIDSEETFKNDNNRRASATDFAAYLRDTRGTHRRPRKTQTPMGEAAKEWGQDFFEGITRVRLERDHPKEIKGRFNRYLVYVFAQKRGQWINYNLEHVRAGMSPYFTKYSYSRRFHDEFVAAEKEARAAKRGIWAPEAESNKDYDERKEWWDARADFIKLFEERAKSREDYIVLTHWDSMKQLEKFIDQEVSVLALVSGIRQGKSGPIRVKLSRRLFNDLTTIFWDKDVFDASGVESHKGEYVVVKGIVQIYENKYRNQNELQLVVKTPSSITRSRVPGVRLDNPTPDDSGPKPTDQKNAQTGFGKGPPPTSAAPASAAPPSSTPTSSTPTSNVKPTSSAQPKTQ